ncbi:hypothetical protein D3C72_2359540 [compost metagenome]
MLDPQHQRLSADRLAHGVAMRGDLIADGGSDQVRPVRVEALLDQKIDLTQVDITQVDGDLLVGGLGDGGEARCARRHESIINHPLGWCMDVST